MNYSMYYIVGIIGAILGLIAALRWVWLIVGIFIPPLLLLAVIGFLLYWAAEPYAEKGSVGKVVRYIEKK